jgi:hypothetical protein
MISIETLAAILAVAFSFYAIIQSRQSHKFSEKVMISQTVIHFTDRFFDLMKGVSSIEDKLLADPDWRYQFWSLHAKEFYFFDKGALDAFMYSLWMADLAELYASRKGEEIWKTHDKYLNVYVHSYGKMKHFYEYIRHLAVTVPDPSRRNEEIRSFVKQTAPLPFWRRLQNRV